MTNDHADLPRELLLAWGLDERSRRAVRPGLSLDRITHAAIAIADARGLDAVSMARVAAELGFTTMSLYRYVESKDQLLTLMVDAAIGPAPKRRSAGQDWRAGLTTWVQAQIEGHAAHPWIIDIPISGPPLLPNQLDWLDWALAIMEATTLTPAERLTTTLLLTGYARSQVRLYTEIERGRVASGRTVREEDEFYARTLVRLVPPERMPALHALVAGGLFDTSQEPALTDDVLFFTFGLERILDGLGHYMSRRDR